MVGSSRWGDPFKTTGEAAPSRGSLAGVFKERPDSLLPATGQGLGQGVGLGNLQGPFQPRDSQSAAGADQKAGGSEAAKAPRG